MIQSGENQCKGGEARPVLLPDSGRPGRKRIIVPDASGTKTLKGTTKMTKSKASPNEGGESPSRLIDERIRAIGGWGGETLARMRSLILAADPEIVETVKWRKPTNPAGVPLWERAVILCTGDAFKDKVKITFGRGAELKDPSGLFNASLEGNAMRAIDIHEGETIDEEAFRALIREAVAANLARRARSGKR